MLGPEELSRPVYRKHIDVDAVDLPCPRQNAEELLIAIAEVRELVRAMRPPTAVRAVVHGLNERGARVSEALEVVGRLLPRFATPEEIDGALERARKQKETP